MPDGLKRFQEAKDFHFITFSCHQRKPLLGAPASRDIFECVLEDTRKKYAWAVVGYVVMPEHIHLLAAEPASSSLSVMLQVLKQRTSRRITKVGTEPLWQSRYYDFNVWSGKKTVEKLRYIHWNPVARGLVQRPEDWKWSSFWHYATGELGTVEIESEWAARRRERDRLGVEAGELGSHPSR